MFARDPLHRQSLQLAQRAHIHHPQGPEDDLEALGRDKHPENPRSAHGIDKASDGSKVLSLGALISSENLSISNNNNLSTAAARRKQEGGGGQEEERKNERKINAD